MSSYNIIPAVSVGSIEDLNTYIDKDQVNKILILTTPTLFKYLEQHSIINNLSAEFQVDCFSKVRPDAPISQLELIKGQFDKPDLLIAIGGGSVIDSAKALSVCWDNESIAKVFYKEELMAGNKISVLAIPTTAGTGAELSYGAILEDSEKGLKGGVRGLIVQANKVLIDVELYKLAPSKLKAEVGFDNLTHAIETFLSTASSPLVKYQSVAAIKTVFDHLANAVKTNDASSVEQVAISATFMGINLAKSSTCLPHRIQYVIGPATKTSHAQGLIMIYKGWLPIIKATKEFSDLASRLDLTADQLVEKITKLKTKLDLNYKLSDYGIKKDNIEELASKVTGNCENDPSYLGKETLTQILYNSL